MFGVERSSRRQHLADTVDVLAAAWRGDAFEYAGRPVLVRPLPPTDSAPAVHVGGSTEEAALRAARAGLGFRPGVPELWDVYVAELERLGRWVPPRPPLSGPAFLFVTEDPERDLDRLAPNLLETTNTYALWALERRAGRTKYQPVVDPSELADRGFRVVTQPAASNSPRSWALTENCASTRSWAGSNLTWPGAAWSCSNAPCCPSSRPRARAGPALDIIATLHRSPPTKEATCSLPTPD